MKAGSSANAAASIFLPCFVLTMGGQNIDRSSRRFRLRALSSHQSKRWRVRSANAEARRHQDPGSPPLPRVSAWTRSQGKVLAARAWPSPSDREATALGGRGWRTHDSHRVATASSHDKTSSAPGTTTWSSSSLFSFVSVSWKVGWWFWRRILLCIMSAASCKSKNHSPFPSSSLLLLSSCCLFVVKTNALMVANRVRRL